MKITVELEVEELNRMVGLAFDPEHAMVQHNWKTRHIAALQAGRGYGLSERSGAQQRREVHAMSFIPENDPRVVAAVERIAV